jgi:DNA invertase Pin-like site-specific DNA recombinase
MLGKLAPGDEVTVTRLAASRAAPLTCSASSSASLTPRQFRSLAEPRADTGTNTGRLMLAVLGGLADVERDLIRTRTAEGRSREKPKGGIWADPH